MSAGGTAQLYGWRRVLFYLMGVLLSGSMVVDAVDRWGTVDSDARMGDLSARSGPLVGGLRSGSKRWKGSLRQQAPSYVGREQCR